MKAWMLAMFGDPPRLVTETITSSRMWTAPATLAVSLSGNGTNGTEYTRESSYKIVFDINYRTDTNLGTGNATWDNFNNVLFATAADLDNDGNATWTRYSIDVWPDGRNRIVSQSTVTVSNAIPGTISISSNMGVTGPITFSGSAVINYSYNGPGQAGTAASGFGKTFPGGAVGQPAPTMTFSDVPVTPGQQYLLTVPQGASITISYYL